MKNTFKKQAITFVGKNVMTWKSDYCKPIGRWWKRYFNKKVRHLELTT